MSQQFIVVRLNCHYLDYKYMLCMIRKWSLTDKSPLNLTIWQTYHIQLSTTDKNLNLFVLLEKKYIPKSPPSKKQLLKNDMNRVYPQRYNWHKDNNVVKSKYNKEYNKEYKLFI